MCTYMGWGRGVCEFGGLEWWNGTVNWTTRVEYWTGLLERHAHKCTIWSNFHGMATSLIFKRYKAGRGSMN